MKQLSIEQMETVYGAKVNWTCISQVADGMGFLGSLAFCLAASNPIGWGLLAISAVGVIASNVADPSACD
jgi:hypothetical protein